MVGVAYFFGVVSGVLIGFIACAALMFRKRIDYSDAFAEPHGDVPHTGGRS